jgi:hypothetical protein
MCPTECCPDCDNINLAESVFNPTEVGNGVCNQCHGEGVERTVIDDIADGLGDPQDYEEGSDACPKCGGDGECKTCDGEGVIEVEGDDSDDSD